jgi:sporulation protein YlmC with PRC-barrel domain
MKKTMMTALALAVGLFAVDGDAAGTSTDTKGRPAARSDADRAAFKMDSKHVESKKLVGMRVKGADGKDLGEIDQLVVDTASGKITHAVVGYGGLAGVGEKKVVVPWADLQFSRNGDKPTVTMDRAKLEAAPRYTRDGDRDRTGAASPATTPAADRDRDGVKNKSDRAPDNSKKQ